MGKKPKPGSLEFQKNYLIEAVLCMFQGQEPKTWEVLTLIVAGHNALDAGLSARELADIINDAQRKACGLD